MKIKLTFPSAISVLTPLKKELTLISFMNFKKIHGILIGYINKLSLLEMVVLINFLIDMNENTRRLKKIIIILLSILSSFGLYQIIKWVIWVFKNFKKRRNIKNEKKENKFQNDKY